MPSVGATLTPYEVLQLADIIFEERPAKSPVTFAICNTFFLDEMRAFLKAEVRVCAWVSV